MKGQRGFSLIEVLVAIAILITVVGLSIGALLQAQSAAKMVSYEANTQENLRAGMHFIVRDLAQAGEGIPQGGISIPNTGTTSTIFRPGTSTTFAYAGTVFTAIPPIMPGSGLGPKVKSVNPATGAVLTATANTDIINVLYADNTLVDINNKNTYTDPVFSASNPVCNGVISTTGAFVTLDANCFKMPGVTNPITTGNLIMFHNQNGTAIEYVTSVAGQTINFAAGDPAGLNQTGLNTGTVYSLQTFNGTTPTGFPSTSITRIWMVTYYIDSTTNPQKPMLVRQVNYPNYPAGAPANPPTQIGDSIEDLTFSYDITASVDPAGTYGNGAGNAPAPLYPDLPTQIRAVNVFLAGRSEYSYQTENSNTFLHNNLATQVCPRSLSFQNLYQTSATQTSN